MTKKIKTIEFRYKIAQEDTQRLQIQLKKNPQDETLYYSALYIAENPDLKDKELLAKGKLLIGKLLSRPGIVIRQETLDTKSTDSDFDSVLHIAERYCEGEEGV